MSTEPYFYLQNVLGSTFYRVCTIPDRQRGSKMHLQISDELLSTESDFYLQNQFLSTQPYFYLQNILGSPFYRVCTIPDSRRGSEMHLQTSDELLSTESNFYLQIQFLSTEPYFYL